MMHVCSGGSRDEQSGERGEGTPAPDAASSAAAAVQQLQSQHLFSGPRSFEATAAKYMMSYKEAEDTDVSVKRSRMVHSFSHVSRFPC
jgi:hypothetical protein